MNNRLLACTLLPLIAAVVAPVAYYGFVVYFTTEQRIACSLAQATNTSYYTISKIPLLLFLTFILIVSITKMCYCTFSCLHTAYVARQEPHSKVQNNPVD